MRTSTQSGVLLACTVSLGLLGCTHCCRRQACPPAGAVAVPGPYNPGLVPSPPVPLQGQAVLPPSPASPLPQGAVAAPPGALLQPPPQFPATPGPGQRSNFSPPPDSDWRPAPGSIQLAPPEPMGGTQRNDSARLYPPTDATPPSVQAPPRVIERPGTSKPAESESRNPPSLPVGIPQFTIAKDRVASGLRPMLDDGLDWLQSHGYRTVLHLRKPGEDDTADRKQVEKRGMRYLSLEVSPQTLSRQVVDEFNKMVADVSHYPLFVYDRDGSLTGGLWYLHFRTSEQAAEDAARVRAGSLGLREDRDGAHREMWLAIQRFLSERAP